MTVRFPNPGTGSRKLQLNILGANIIHRSLFTEVVTPKYGDPIINSAVFFLVWATFNRILLYCSMISITPAADLAGYHFGGLFSLFIVIESDCSPREDDLI